MRPPDLPVLSDETETEFARMARQGRFHLGDVLSVVAMRNLSLRGIEGVDHLVGYMMNDAIRQRDMPLVLRICRDTLLAKYPHLISWADQIPNTRSKWQCDEFVRQLANRNGAFVDVPVLRKKPVVPELKNRASHR